MKLDLKIQARKLRKNGCSITTISNNLKVSKSTASLWVRDIIITSNQIALLSSNRFSRIAIEKRRKTRLENETNKRNLLIELSRQEPKFISKRELWLIGTMLYWAEGGKTQRGLVRFSNGDPEMIKIMLKFFKTICKVPENKFRAYIHIHPHLNSQLAEEYWSNVTGIPLNHFYKTYKKVNISSKNTRNSLPNGTLDIYICDTKLFLRISGWVKGIFDSTNKPR
jgi:hypothetical protein